MSHLHSKGVVSLLTFATFALAGCSESNTAPAATIAPSDFAMAALSGTTALSLLGSSSGPHERACPAGGSTISDGTVSTSGTASDNTITWTLSVQPHDCAFAVNGNTFVTSGNTQSQGTLHVRLFNAQGQGPAILGFDSHEQGQLTATQGTTSTTCSFDLSQHYDPARNETHLTGTSCGHTIDIVSPGL